MTEKTNGVKSPITLRRAFATAAVLLVFALVFVAPAAAVAVGSQDELNDAINKAETGVSTAIVLSSGTYKLYNNDNLSGKIVTFKSTDNAIINLTELRTEFYAGEIIFDGVTLELTNNNHIGLTHTSKITFIDCTIKGKLFLYAPDVTFTCCTFVNKNDYCVWTYGAKNVVFTECKFDTGGKAILVYNEDINTGFETTITLNHCTFDDDETLNTVKAAVETGIELGSTNKYNLIFKDCTVSGFAVNDEGASTGSTLWGNKNSMDPVNLHSTIDGVDVSTPRTITFNLNGGSGLTETEITGIPGTPLTQEQHPDTSSLTKAGVVFDKWDKTIPAEIPTEDMTITAIWKAQSTYSFIYSLADETQATIFKGETLSIPINLTNNDVVAPSVWRINVTVEDDTRTKVDGLTYDLTVKPSYATQQSDDGFALQDEPNKFDVPSRKAATGEVSGLFTITISGLQTAGEYTVKIDIISEVRVNGNDLYGKSETTLTKQVTVQDMLCTITHNFDHTEGEHGQWSLDNESWAQISIGNGLKAGETSFKTAQKNELVKRGDYSLYLLSGGEYTISTVTETATSQTTVTTLSEEGGYIVINVGQGDETAKEFIIEFTGRKVGDIANTGSNQNKVDVTDSEAILAHWVSDATEIIIKPGYEVYADIDMKNGINSADATYAYLKGVNKLDSATEATFLLPKA